MGVEDIMTNRVIWGHPKTNNEHSCIVFSITSIAFILNCLGSKMLKLPAQSLTGSPRTLSQAGDFGLGFQAGDLNTKTFCRSLLSGVFRTQSIQSSYLSSLLAEVPSQSTF